MLIHTPSGPDLRAGAAAYPGFPIKAGPERSQLRPGQGKRLSLAAGDVVTIINDEGAARARLLAFGHDGRADPGLIGLEGATFDLGAPGLAPIEAWLAAMGRRPAPLVGAEIFDDQTRPGDRFVLRARQDCHLWAVLPSGPRGLTEGGAGGVMTVEIKRAAGPSQPLPEPLGEIREEFRIDRATARAYRVAAGDYIQVIDVDGQQCSDFMALRADALEQGQERHIDSTVTRTMVRGAYPGPGLFDKFFDQDMRPLLTVVRDTVGRHDTFALACTARGYEERGFPGHANCSDNISAAYTPYGIARRRAWPAINFFFNSWIEAGSNRLAADEAWSRPGDYVVMRALTDLVCVSTACPDDVDPINGWNPSDVHVRIYKPEQPISRAVAYRAEPEAEAILTEESAFHPRTSTLTRSFHVARDLWLPASYEATRAIDEYWACRSAVTLQDLSSLRKFDVIGPDAEALLQIALTRDVRKLSINRGTYALLCDESGSVIDDGTLFRLSPEVFRWCCGSDDSGQQLKTLAESRGLKVWIKSLFSAMPNLALQGPNSRDVLMRMVFTQSTHPSIENLKWFGFTIGRVGDRDGAPFMLTRTGYTGELGYEIFCDRADALTIWDALVEAGHDLGLKPMGGEALEMIRIEAGLMAAGAEFGPGVDALEAGLGFAVDLAKPDFVGKAALARNAAAPRNRLVGLAFDGDEAPAHGDGVFVGRRQVGTVTSATRSPTLGHAIAMARVAVEYGDSGAALEVGRLDGHMKRLPARVTGIPFIDPKRERARA